VWYCRNILDGRRAVAFRPLLLKGKCDRIS
jgi:hypothetical protein